MLTCQRSAVLLIFLALIFNLVFIHSSQLRSPHASESRTDLCVMPHGKGRCPEKINQGHHCIPKGGYYPQRLLVWATECNTLETIFLMAPETNQLPPVKRNTFFGIVPAKLPYLGSFLLLDSHFLSLFHPPRNS